MGHWGGLSRQEDRDLGLTHQGDHALDLHEGPHDLRGHRVFQHRVVELVRQSVELRLGVDLVLQVVVVVLLPVIE